MSSHFCFWLNRRRKSGRGAPVFKIEFSRDGSGHTLYEAQRSQAWTTLAWLQKLGYAVHVCQSTGAGWESQSWAPKSGDISPLIGLPPPAYSSPTGTTATTS
jgi:hypothetical protein